MARLAPRQSTTSKTQESAENPFPYCANEGWQTDELLKPTFQLSQLQIVKKGLVHELFLIYKKFNLPWEQFSNWLKGIFGVTSLPRKDTILKSLAALHTKRNNFIKHGSTSSHKLVAMLEEAYSLPKSRGPQLNRPANSRSYETTVEMRAGTPSLFLQETLQRANSELAAEAQLLREKNRQLEIDRAELLAKVSEFKPHNVRRRERRKQKLISEQRKLIKCLKKTLKHAKKAALKAPLLYSKQHYYKSKYQAAMSASCTCCKELQAANRKLQLELNSYIEATASQDEHDHATHAHDDAAHAHIYTFFKEGKYVDSVRVCVMELLGNGVPVRRVEAVLKAVLKMVDVTYDRLPKHSVVNNMLAEARGLAHLQIAEHLTEAQSSTLHSDGTSKFGQKYLGFQVATNEGSYTVGLKEVVSGDADTMLATLNEVLLEVEQTANFDASSSTDVGKQILVNIKNTMSDRAATQKSFNDLLEAYRMNILPEVVSEWEELSADEQASMGTMYHFFCGVHLIGNMADHAAEALRLFEASYREEFCSSPQDSLSGPVQLVRTACKAFERRGSEKSGYPLKFAAFLRRKGVYKVPLAHFKGNRFNILFHNAAGVYFLRDLITEFLTDVLGTPNRLLKSVLADVQDEFNTTGCRVLGMIDKLVTTPFWRALESNIHIKEVPKICSKLLSFFKSCEDDSQQIRAFLEGEFTPFPDISVKRDDVWNSLVQSREEIDPLAVSILQAIFQSLSLLVARFVDDSSTPDFNSLSTVQETTSVCPANIISERDFAQLDHLIRKKPSATLLALEAHILFTNNKTAHWLTQKDEKEKERLLSVARKLGPKHRKQFRERLASLKVQQEEAIQKKQEEAEKQREKVLLQKEKLTGDIVKLGLWQSSQDVDAGLRVLRSETSKRDAIKTQLKFRKTVLEQKYKDMSVFQFSKNKTQYTSTVLKENLLLLLADATMHDQVSEDPQVCFLVGARIDHQFIEDEKLVTYSGEVISQVPGFAQWYNVVYDNEPGTVYTYKLLDDLKNGDLKVV